MNKAPAGFITTKKNILMKIISIPRAGLILRVVLGITMLSAVADRFGFWGPAGSPGVAWGNWHNFILYTQQLNAFAPESVAEVLGVLATLAEISLSILLIIGYKTRIAAVGTGFLMLLFASAMSVSSSVKAPLDYSVLTSAAAAFLLSAVGITSFALDNYRRRPGR